MNKLKKIVIWTFALCICGTSALAAELTPEDKGSVLPLAEKQAEALRSQMEAYRQWEKMMRGETNAPDFTFKDIDGKDVSLSDFRGKWVVIDFWGAWCGWCIKGFPALKEAYKKYNDRMVVIGVDCNDTPQAWRDAVRKYDLPWVNVYNDQKDGELLMKYGIQGFPTKAIINPEGKLVDLTTGEDPSFYSRLATFLTGEK